MGIIPLAKDKDFQICIPPPKIAKERIITRAFERCEWWSDNKELGLKQLVGWNSLVYYFLSEFYLTVYF